MSVYSMTGFASIRKALPAPSEPRAAKNVPHMLVSLELRSVNSRFLDLGFRLPEELREHEPALRALLTQALHRGKVELRASAEATDMAGSHEVSTQSLQQLARLQSRIQTWLSDAAPLSVADVLRLTHSNSQAQGPEAQALLELTGQLLKDFVAARAREGERLAALLLQRLTEMEQLAAQAQPLVPQAVEAQKQRFLARWQEALSSADSELPTAAVQERALAEAAAYALRIDVSEELDRLRAHLSEIRSVLEAGGAVGKRLDFLIQELHREANTLGSKSTALELSRIGVDMKVLIEQMREQVQNIE